MPLSFPVGIYLTLKHPLVSHILKIPTWGTSVRGKTSLFLWKSTEKLPKATSKCISLEIIFTAQHKFRPRHRDETVLLQWWIGLLLSVGRREASVLIPQSRFMLKLLTLGSHCLPYRNWQDNTLRGFECFLNRDIYFAVMGPCSSTAGPFTDRVPYQSVHRHLMVNTHMPTAGRWCASGQFRQ